MMFWNRAFELLAFVERTGFSTALLIDRGIAKYGVEPLMTTFTDYMDG
jgi:hypothetical protein